MGETQGSGRERAYASIRRQIVSLVLAPGSSISENELAAGLGLSRTPVREALVVLAGENLVQVFPKIGTFVARVDPAQVAEAQFLREAVEVESLRSLVPPLREDIMDELRANVAEQERATIDTDSFFQVDEDFHRGLMRLAGHGVSWTTVAAAKAHLDRARMLGLTSQPLSQARAVREHRRILDAVESRDIDAAVTTLHDHLRSVFDDIVRLQTRSPDLFSLAEGQQPVRRSVAVWE